MRYSLLFFSSSSIYCGFVLCVDPLVLTSHGLVQGLRSSDGGHSLFLGIPYARVDPENPFGASIDVSPFQDTFQAFDDSVVCPQGVKFNYNVDMKLDCLHVNLYIPHSASSRNPLPVMIWIHGGGFINGSGNKGTYGEKFIIRHNVILVTLNYRLGIFGFLNTNSPDIPGNAGLKDQLAALRWIKRNIAAFGGDPNNLTLFGQGAGAVSIEFHMLSDLTDGLFHKVIMQSGTTLCDWVMSEFDEALPLKLAMQIGLHTNDKEIAIDYLKRAEPQKLLNATMDLNLIFKPSIERIFDGVEAMVKDISSNVLKSGTYRDIPILCGINTIESSEDYSVQMNTFDTSTKTVDDKLAYYFNFTNAELTEAYKLVQQFYSGDGKLLEDSIRGMIEFNSDFSYIHPLERSMAYHLNRSTNSIYQYIFAYAGGRYYLHYPSNITPGRASHGDELAYLFDSSHVSSLINDNDQLIIDRVTTMWTNFAKYSDPTPSTSHLIPIKWETSHDDSRRFLLLDNKMHMTYHPYHRRMAFWNIFFTLYRDKQKW